MSQDVGQELNGRFTAFVEQMILANGMLTTLNGVFVGFDVFCNEIKNLAVQRNSYLLDMVELFKKMRSEFNMRLDDIVKNTKGA